MALWTLETIPRKGKGLLARKDITVGTLILSDNPLLIISTETTEEDLAYALENLSKKDQHTFLSLHNNQPGSKNPLSNIIRANGCPLGPAANIGGVFPNLSRINHSCKPNTKHSWNPIKEQYMVYTIRPIRKGDEITISYLPGGESKRRQEILKKAFGFTCTCELCSLPATELRASDNRLIHAEALNETIGDPETVRYSPGKILKNCKKFRDLYMEEGILDDRLPNLWYDCFQVVNLHGDQARASAFASQYCSQKRRMEGPDSVDAAEIELYIEDPSRHASFGSTQDWKTSVDEVPKDLDTESFDKWLWRENA